MNARSLTPQQRGAVRGQVLRQREYLGRLVARMDALGFPADHPIGVAAVGARDAVEGFSHHVGCPRPAEAANIVDRGGPGR